VAAPEPAGALATERTRAAACLPPPRSRWPTQAAQDPFDSFDPHPACNANAGATARSCRYFIRKGTSPSFTFAPAWVIGTEDHATQLSRVWPDGQTGGNPFDHQFYVTCELPIPELGVSGSLTLTFPYFCGARRVLTYTGLALVLVAAGVVWHFRAARRMVCIRRSRYEWSTNQTPCISQNPVRYNAIRPRPMLEAPGK